MAANVDLLNSLSSHLSVISFNMHGYNQGVIVVSDIIGVMFPDIIMVQEHWLTPAN